MDIVIERLPRDADVELVVRGRLDAECAGELRQAVAAEIRSGVHAITLDLAGVAFLSSAGIRVLFETQREARTAGGDCRVSVASDPVRKVLDLTRLSAILMQPAAASSPALKAAAPPPTRDLAAPGVRLLGFELPPAGPLAGRIHGSAAPLAGQPGSAERLSFSARSFAIGIGALADDSNAQLCGTGYQPAPLQPPAGQPLGPRQAGWLAQSATAGELVAAGGAVYHRPPQPFAAVDYILGTGDLVPEADLVTGLSWEGFPGGRAGFEPVADAPAVTINDLAAALLVASAADTLAVVIAGEVHGLVAAELIRPLAEATPTDHPLTASRELAARWLCFSREPVHAGRTAIVVGVITRVAVGPLAEIAAPLGPDGVCGHLHAAVFPHRPLRRAAGELAAVVADLVASEPLAVMHLMHDDRPVLGSGQSGFIRGACWFAPLTLTGGDA